MQSRIEYEWNDRLKQERNEGRIAGPPSARARAPGEPVSRGVVNYTKAGVPHWLESDIPPERGLEAPLG